MLTLEELYSHAHGAPLIVNIRQACPVAAFHLCSSECIERVMDQYSFAETRERDIQRYQQEYDEYLKAIDSEDEDYDEEVAEAWHTNDDQVPSWIRNAGRPRNQRNITPGMHIGMQRGMRNYMLTL
jgi:hypothetical protein